MRWGGGEGGDDEDFVYMCWDSILMERDEMR